MGEGLHQTQPVTLNRKDIIAGIKHLGAYADVIETAIQQGDLHRAMDHLTRIQHSIRETHARLVAEEQGLHPINADTIVHVDGKYFKHLRRCEQELIKMGSSFTWRSDED